MNNYDLQNNFNTNLLIQKIKPILFSVGLNEKYIAFEYLTSILTFFIKNNDSSLSSYLKIVETISMYHKIEKLTIVQSLSKLLKKITDENITNNITLNLTKNRTLNILRNLTQLIKNKINTHF